LTAARRLLAAFATCALAVGVTACGGGDEAPAAGKPNSKSEAAVANKAKAAADRAQGNPGMANAVVTSKTAAAVDLQFDVASKPKPGEPFEITLSFAPRLPADSLEVEVTGMPGLTVVTGGTSSFQQVQAGGRHEAKVLVRADAPGLYYVNVVSKMVSKVQTDARTFSVPIVVGDATAAQKPAATATTDATGEKIESAKALETTGSKQTQ
jgi:hypothetical protein